MDVASRNIANGENITPEKSHLVFGAPGLEYGTGNTLISPFKWGEATKAGGGNRKLFGITSCNNA